MLNFDISFSESAQGQEVRGIDDLVDFLARISHFKTFQDSWTDSWLVIKFVHFCYV